MYKYKVKLSKIKSIHQNLRTDTIEGFTESLPKIDEDFKMFAESLTPEGDFRYVHTTEVCSIDFLDKNTYLFDTVNSKYKLEVLDEE